VSPRFLSNARLKVLEARRCSSSVIKRPEYVRLKIAISNARIKKAVCKSECGSRCSPLLNFKASTIDLIIYFLARYQEEEYRERIRLLPHIHIYAGACNIAGNNKARSGIINKLIAIKTDPNKKYAQKNIETQYQGEVKTANPTLPNKTNTFGRKKREPNNDQPDGPLRRIRNTSAR
jgi:hypothetical protein